MFFAQVEPGGLADTIDRLARTPLSKVIIFVAICTTIRVLLVPYLAKTEPHRRVGAWPVAKFANEALDAIIYAGVFVFLLIRPFAIQAFRIPSESMERTLLVGDFIIANKAIYRYTEPKRHDIIVFRPPKGAILDPKNFDSDGEVNVDYIKRCVGVPGDLVEIKNGLMFVNGKLEKEAYAPSKPEPFIDSNSNGIYDPGEQYTDTNTNKVWDAGAPMDLDFKLVKYEDKYIPLNITADMVNAGSYAAEEFQVKDSTKMAELRALPAEKIPPGYLLMMGDNRPHSFDGRGWGLLKRDDVIGRAEFIWLPFSRIGSVRKYGGY